MTNPVDDEDEKIEDIEPTADNAEEEIETSEEMIPDDEKPVKKKVAALKARHELEDFFELKKIRDALDYLYDEEGAKDKDKETR